MGPLAVKRQLERITGRKPRSLREVMLEHRGQWPI